jgi:hypothetical protein
MGEAGGGWERALKGWERIYRRDRWQVFRNPAPDEWPEPTAEELARRERLDMVVETALSGIGLAPGRTREIDVDALIKWMMVQPPDEDEDRGGEVVSPVNAVL